MASRPGSQRRAEGLNQWGGCARRQRMRPDVISDRPDVTFNSLRRDSFLSVACVRTPDVYSLLWQAYSSQTRSFFGEEEFASETGIASETAPIGPAFFALSVDEAARGVQSELNVWYWTIWRCYSRRLPGEGLRRFTVITGETRNTWLGGQWEQMWAMQQGNAFSIFLSR